eukprot:CAMPEP_0117842330 /NCGR_PEP_ID=MMETSP0949-20121206/15952_1 /TAXON_ID=44440 /ORGANISM="Chattonella subsalsa, Strain CCMP2191" /LENGTH=239 /DNA_ID=CAMNT_0005686361 /DNA_START=18 /DNA_END=733 /DNA_ORIENTATION=-
MERKDEVSESKYKESDDQLSFRNELASLDHDLSFFPERCFDFNGFSIVMEQDVGDVGGQVWDAEVVLAHYLDQMYGKSSIASHQEDSTNAEGADGINKLNCKVLELGAGTGLAGLVAAYLGATTVITDIEPTVQITQRIADTVLSEKGKDYSVEELAWGENLDSFKEKHGCFDVILASDVVYHEHLYDALIETFQELSSELGVVYVSFEQRRRDLSPFFERIQHCFCFEKVNTPRLLQA